MATTQECHHQELFNFWPSGNNWGERRELTFSEHLLGANIVSKVIGSGLEPILQMTKWRL